MRIDAASDIITELADFWWISFIFFIGVYFEISALDSTEVGKCRYYLKKVEENLLKFQIKKIIHFILKIIQNQINMEKYKLKYLKKKKKKSLEYLISAYFL